MIRLTEGVGALRSLLPPHRETTAWHAALTDEIAHHLSPEHAVLLAWPERDGTGVAWLADGIVKTPYAELPAAESHALNTAVGAILSDIRRLAESGVAPAVREAWPALREIPDLGHLFAVDGRPVLAAWGHAGTGAPGRFARLDDGVPWRPKPRPPWARYGKALCAITVLALLAEILLPRAASWFIGQPVACTILPGQLDTLRGQTQLDDRGQGLRAVLAALTEEVGRRQLMCPIAEQPQPTPASQEADLSQDRWDQRDLSMFEGCWNLYTSLTISNHARTTSSKARTWRMCFDRHGFGQQSLLLEDGRSCEGSLAVAFDQGSTLRVTESEGCHGPTLQMNRAVSLCRRLSEGEAQCNGHNLDDAGAEGSSFTGRFRR